MQKAAGHPIPFGERLQQLLASLSPPRRPAWLAKESGLTPSVLSRLLTGKRGPMLDHVEAIAPVFGLDVAALLRGTDAEQRLQEFTDWVKRDHYDAAIQKMVEFESRNNQLHEQLRESLDARNGLMAKLDETRGRAAELEIRHEQVGLEMKVLENKLARSEDRARRYYEALEKAVARLSEQNVKLQILADELKDQRQSSKTTGILTWVAAAAGVVTVATLLSDENPDETSDEEE